MGIERGERLGNMNTYLAIITALLVITQIIRVTQNHISLKRQEKSIKDNCEWINDVDMKREDFETQREAYKLIVDYFTNIDKGL